METVLCVGAGGRGSESGNQMLSDRIFMKEIVGDSLSSLLPPPSSPEKLPSFFVYRNAGTDPPQDTCFPSPWVSCLILHWTWEQACYFLSRKRVFNLLPASGSQPEPSAPVRGRCPDPVPHAQPHLRPKAAPVPGAGSRVPPYAGAGHSAPGEEGPRLVEGAGRGSRGEALGSWVARQTSKPQRIL